MTDQIDCSRLRWSIWQNATSSKDHSLTEQNRFNTAALCIISFFFFLCRSKNFCSDIAKQNQENVTGQPSPKSIWGWLWGVAFRRLFNTLPILVKEHKWYYWIHNRGSCLSQEYKSESGRIRATGVRNRLQQWGSSACQPLHHWDSLTPKWITNCVTKQKKTWNCYIRSHWMYS